MKIRRQLLEASNMSEYDKMREFENGTRRENVKACGDDKLFRYQKICKDNNFKNALAKIEAEMQNRDLLSNNTATSTATTATTSNTTASSNTMPGSTTASNNTSNSTTTAATTANNSGLPPLLKVIDKYESLIPDIMDRLRQAKTIDKLEQITAALGGQLILILLYLIVAVLSKYTTAQNIFKDTIIENFNINIKAYMQEGFKDPATKQRLAELISKYNLVMY